MKTPGTLATFPLALLAIAGAGLAASTAARSTPRSSFETRYRIDSEHVRAGPLTLGKLEGLAEAP